MSAVKASVMPRKEIESLQRSIVVAQDSLDKGLIVDFEAASQLRRMIYYYEQQIDEQMIAVCPVCEQPVYLCDLTALLPHTYECAKCHVLGSYDPEGDDQYERV